MNYEHIEISMRGFSKPSIKYPKRIITSIKKRGKFLVLSISIILPQLMYSIMDIKKSTNLGGNL
jgi:hypothetical protein